MVTLESNLKLPEYTVINNPLCQNRQVLRTSAETVRFPLDKETREIICQLEAKFDQEDNCAGLAAPQIGYPKRIIVFAVAEDEELKKFRADLSDTMPKSIWINPSFTPLSEEKTIDWEACFSVHDLAGQVSRFTEISYEAWTPEGKKITGTAKGFLARLLQHEIDHLNKTLFIDYVEEKELITMGELKKARAHQ